MTAPGGAARPHRPPKPLVRRLLGPPLAAAGVHVFRMYRGERDLEEPLAEPAAGLDFEIADAGPDDLAELLDLVPDAQRAACRDAAGFGSSCMLARHAGRIAGYSWYDLRLLTVRHIRIAELPPDAGYTFASYVLPEFRGQKLFQLLTHRVYGTMRAAGRRRGWNLVERDNAASIAARERLGATFVPVTIVKLPGLRAIYREG